MTRFGMLCLAALTGLAATPSFAATEQECEAAIVQTQRDAADDAVLAANDDRTNQLTTTLAEAGAAGQQGDYDRCLQLVTDARGSAGLEN